MNLDRSLLSLLVVTMFVRIIHAGAPLCELLCIVSGFQVWRLHPKGLRADASFRSADAIFGAS